MSTAAAPNYSGSTRQSSSLPGTSGTAARKPRTPLALVRSTPRKRRAPFVVLCFALLAVALVTVLVLNISVSTSQYELVSLRSTQATLTKENQDLTQQQQNFEAPQNLAAKAADLGMVASTSKGQIDLSTLSVSGKAAPAAEGKAPGTLLPAPAVGGLLSVVPPASASDPLESRAPAEQPAKAAVAAAPTPELNGGSVPAPEQKTPGQ